jgi:hypothetical protein
MAYPLLMLPHSNRFGNGVRRSANKNRSSLANEVLQYLVNHERACDTVEGIVDWWLPMQEIRYAISQVEAALRELVASGFVISQPTSDGRMHYRVNPSANQAIGRRVEMKTSRLRKRAEPPSRARKKN